MFLFAEIKTKLPIPNRINLLTIQNKIITKY